jgi:predicted transcriptional regulator
MRVKKLVYLDDRQDKRVKQLAREAKTSETEVIRRAIDAYGRGEAAEVAADTLRVMKHIQDHAGGWVDEPSEFFHG